MAISVRVGLVAALALALVPLGCPRRDRRDEVMVYAAASLAAPLRALEASYEREHPEVDVVLNFAGSQLLAAQLIEGAPADVFISADAQTLDRVLLARPAAPDSRRLLARNALVVALASGVSLATVEALASSDLRVVLANDQVPVGRYAREALAQLGLHAAVDRQLVSSETSVDGVLTKLELGEADVGLVYATDLARAPSLGRLALPAAVEIEARYELAILAEASAAARSRPFVAYLLGDAGRAQLRADGFLID